MTSNRNGPNPHQGSRASSLLFWLIFHGVASFIVLAVLLVVVPMFDKMFMEFGLKLPFPSVLVVNLSRFVVSYGLLVIPMWLILDSGMLCLLILPVEMPRWLRSLWCGGVLIVAACLIVLVAISLVLPFVGLVQGLS